MTPMEAPEVPAELYVRHRPGNPEYRYEFIDSVDPGIPRDKKWVLMLSTQFGCAVGCRMCDAGASGYRGNLTEEELLGQLRAVFASRPEIRPESVPKLKVHFARMGEPTFNPAILDCLETLRLRPGEAGVSALPGLLPSISTVAPDCEASASFLDRLAVLKNRHFSGGMFQLQFSIHSTDEEARRALIPIRKWSFERIADFGRAWLRPGDRKITLNFALAEDIPFDSCALAHFFPREDFLVKFTPVHPTARAERNGLTTSWFEAPPRIRRFEAELRDLGYEVIVNPAWPEEVRQKVGCGQLATRGSSPLASPPKRLSAEGAATR